MRPGSALSHSSKKEERTCEPFTKIAATLGVIGTIAIGSMAPAAAFWVGHRHYYYNYGGGTWNGCPPDWTIQGGVCKPYRHGPWDYGGPRWGWYR
jgi:hypothetical protein